MTLIEYVRAALGVSTSRDTELQTLIESAKMDMRIRGVVSIVETDEYTMDVIADYCKAARNFQGDAARYQACYERRADTMAQTAIYNTLDGVS